MLNREIEQPRAVSVVIATRAALRALPLLAAEFSARKGTPDVAAAIVLRAPCEEEALSTYARQHLASYQVPRVFAFVDALPTNAVGKVQKPSVRELFEP